MPERGSAGLPRLGLWACYLPALLDIRAVNRALAKQF
jgi:hypothetical protein